MSKLNVDQQTIKRLFEDKKSNFLIPDYQRPYAWTTVECQTLWDDKQKLLPLETTFEIEHIFARNRQEKERTLTNNRNLEAIGNKAMLEKRINIRASDYRFSDKIKYYRGFVNLRGQKKEGTNIYELANMAETRTDFVESDIEARTKQIVDGFIDYLKSNDLITE